MINTFYTSGIEPVSYMENLRNYRKLVNDLYTEATAPPEWMELFTAAASGLRISVMTEDWCGDSACNVPLLTRMAEAAGVGMRVFRSSEFPDLQEYYKEREVTHIPVVSFWDEQGSEVFRWVERPVACAEPADRWKAAHPEFNQLRQGADKESKKGFARIYREFLEEMAGWYRRGLWNETAREIAEGLNAARSGV